jgi:hypothetical protein
VPHYQGQILQGVQYGNLPKYCGEVNNEIGVQGWCGSGNAGTFRGEKGIKVGSLGSTVTIPHRSELGRVVQGYQSCAGGYTGETR